MFGRVGLGKCVKSVYGSYAVLIETSPLRRGGPLCPPAQEKIAPGLCDVV